MKDYRSGSFFVKLIGARDNVEGDIQSKHFSFIYRRTKKTPPGRTAPVHFSIRFYVIYEETHVFTMYLYNQY